VRIGIDSLLPLPHFVNEPQAHRKSCTVVDTVATQSACLQRQRGLELQYRELPMEESRGHPNGEKPRLRNVNQLMYHHHILQYYIFVTQVIENNSLNNRFFLPQFLRQGRT
jgi:hypothetical protein